jgi:outer membrane immunogenic protein
MKSVFTFAALALAGSGALAADLPRRSDAPAPSAPASRTFSALDPWAGFYLGGAASWDSNIGRFNTAGVGYALPDGLTAAGNAQTNAPAAGSTYTFTRALHAKAGDQLGGALFFGYNMQANNLVAGFEADLHSSHDQTRSHGAGVLAIDGAYANATDAVNGDTGEANGAFTLDRKSRVLWDGSLRARVGAALSDDVLFFVTGGLAIAQLRHGLSVSGVNVFKFDTGAEQATQTANAAATRDRIALGWTLGAGVDVRLAASWILRAEYRFSDYGDAQVEAKGQATCAPAPARTCDGVGDGAVVAKAKFHDVSHSARVGVAYLFNAAPPPRAILARY